MASFRLRVFLKGRVLNTGLVKTKDCGRIRLVRTEASVRQSRRLFLSAGPTGSESSTGAVRGPDRLLAVRLLRDSFEPVGRIFRRERVGPTLSETGRLSPVIFANGHAIVGDAFILLSGGAHRCGRSVGERVVLRSRSPSPIRIRRCAATGCFCRGRYEVRCSGRGAAGRREFRGVRCSAAGASWFLSEERRSECFGGRFG